MPRRERRTCTESHDPAEFAGVLLRPCCFDNGRRIEYPSRVRALSLTRVLFVLLAFQLAVGLQINAAQAGIATPGSTMAMDVAHAAASVATGASLAIDSSTSDEACPMHGGSHTAPSPRTGHDHFQQDNLAPGKPTADKHDCCKSSGCQCQCGNLPLAVNVSVVRGIFAPTVVQRAPAARRVAALAESHFRPPIAG
jgi:hypothetical protein